MAAKRKPVVVAESMVAARPRKPGTFLPGNPDGRAGRKPGQVDITTRKAREAIAVFVDQRAEDFTRWMMQIEDPYNRCNVFLKLIEFHLPKLSRVEMPDLAPAGDADDLYERLVAAMTHVVDVRKSNALEHKPEVKK